MIPVIGYEYGICHVVREQHGMVSLYMLCGERVAGPLSIKFIFEGEWLDANNKCMGCKEAKEKLDK